jgi:hypothetical protein
MRTVVNCGGQRPDCSIMMSAFFLVEPRGFEPLTSWLQTIGGAVDEGHWSRSGQYRRSVRCHGRQCGCCTFVLHPQGKTWAPPRSTERLTSSA